MTHKLTRTHHKQSPVSADVRPDGRKTAIHRMVLHRGRRMYVRYELPLLIIGGLLVAFIWSLVLWGHANHKPRPAMELPALGLRLLSAPINPLEGGLPFVISGNGFTTNHPMRVMVGNHMAKDVFVASSGTITAIAPAGNDGYAAVEVVRYDGQRARIADSFRYSKSLPQIGTVDPEEGPVSGGTEVTITGSNFTPTDEVWFDNKQAAKVTFVSAHQLKAVTPVESRSGSADVTIINQLGESSNESDFDFEQ